MNQLRMFTEKLVTTLRNSSLRTEQPLTKLTLSLLTLSHATTLTSLYGVRETIQVVFSHGLMRLFVALKVKVKAQSSFLIFLLVTTLVCINGQLDTKPSLTDSSTSLDSQSMGMSTWRCTTSLDLLLKVSLLVFTTGLVLFLLGTKLIHLSECLRLMLRPCFPLKSTPIS